MKHSVLTKIHSNLLRIFAKAEKTSPLTLLLAVSGGADSIGMLYAVSELRENLNCNLFVVTVNHNIRSKNESLGDVLFVSDFCKNLKIPVQCFISEFKENEVMLTASIRKGGIEEAARFLRYREFEKLSERVGADYILTAHNKNDYYETVLMRLFQGADSQSISGIAEERGKFIRPMLDISRSEIEDFLKSNGIVWREDLSNFDQVYLRNRIRHSLIPALNMVFDGWQTGLGTTLKKLDEESRFIMACYEEKKASLNSSWSFEKEKNEVVADFYFFKNLETVFKIRFIEEGLLLIKDTGRIPYSVIKKLSEINETETEIYSGGFYIEKKDSKIRLLKKSQPKKDKTVRSYMIWVDKPCTFFLPEISEEPFEIYSENGKLFLKSNADGGNEVGPFTPPFCIRSRQAGDVIKTKSGSEKHIKKILNDWHIDYEKKDSLPIIEEKGVIRGIYGAVMGKKNMYIPADEN
ncbi:tRNA lysidine(34) synthetase TilS [Treponema pedis]|uniref:tRNA(Ile)-lysidine synthase n=1 Tax=Treponema pedis str. T A4 TaxID=1291379 RepID=S5ZXE7_9SPIR|nr:tRNA lysidine(34) synthetase TilS [Treponema pedis]AGT42673.1 PP-loop family ATPase [Treponema pedis str. T A4]